MLQIVTKSGLFSGSLAQQLVMRSPNILEQPNGIGILFPLITSYEARIAVRSGHGSLLLTISQITTANANTSDLIEYSLLERDSGA